MNLFQTRCHISLAAPRNITKSSTLVYLVAHWITDHYHLSSNLGAVIYEGCFIFDFITSGGHSAHLAYHVHKVAVKHQSINQSINQSTSQFN